MKTFLTIAILTGSATLAMAQSKEQLIGCWTMPQPHPGEHLQLLRNSRFVFQDWNAKKGDFDYLTGTWSSVAEKGKVTLYYTDRTKQSFNIRKNSKGAWYLSKTGGFLFTKSDPSDCK